MGIFGVDGSQRKPRGQQKKAVAGDTGVVKKQNATIKDLQEQMAALQDYVEAVHEFLDQFQAIADLDRDGIIEAAKQMGIKGVKSNTADRDVLSKIFGTLRASMLGKPE